MEIILEGVRSVIKKYNGKISPTFIKLVADKVDPSPTKKYTEWLIKQWWLIFSEKEKANASWLADYAIKYPENFIVFVRNWADVISKYYELCKNNVLKGKESDIYSIDSLPELRRVVDDAWIKWKSKSEKVNKYDFNNWLIVIPSNKIQSIIYGQHTKWCISSSILGNQFDEYNEKNYIFIFINKNTNSKYAVLLNRNMPWTYAIWNELDDRLPNSLNQIFGITIEKLMDFYRSANNVQHELYKKYVDSGLISTFEFHYGKMKNDDTIVLSEEVSLDGIRVPSAQLIGKKKKEYGNRNIHKFAEWLSKYIEVCTVKFDTKYSGAAYDDETDIIYINPFYYRSANRLEDVLRHELTHYVQTKKSKGKMGQNYKGGPTNTRKSDIIYALQDAEIGANAIQWALRGHETFEDALEKESPFLKFTINWEWDRLTKNEKIWINKQWKKFRMQFYNQKARNE